MRTRARRGAARAGTRPTARGGLVSYLLRRLIALPLVLWAAVSLVFFSIHLIPGDPVDMVLGETARPADREALRARWGLDRSVPEQYARYLTGLVRGQLGESYSFRRPVSDLVAERYPATLLLAGSAMAVALLLAIPLGALAALRRNRPIDRASMLVALLGVSVPNFWLGILLMLVFSLWLDWLPVSGFDGPASVVLPAVTLGASLAGILTRMTRSSLLDELGHDYVRTARAKGLGTRATLFKHALRNALIPVVTLVGLQFGALLAGAIITEKVFGWPGIGALLISGVQARDYPVVQGCIAVIVTSYVLVNLVTDLLYSAIHPRVRLGESA
ncbi:MAG: ABC transporter permease [Myxococcales bacterium]|nr:ABC transporter permease [Myxococcales bacterium]